MSDLISREHLHERINETVHEGLIFSGMTIAEFIEALIDAEPSVETDLSEYSDKLWQNAYERGKAEAERTGHWADGHQYGFSGTYWYRYCSLCGYVRSDDDEEKDTNYCPNCGARMKGEEDVSESN